MERKNQWQIVQSLRSNSAKLDFSMKPIQKQIEEEASNYGVRLRRYPTHGPCATVISHAPATRRCRLRST